MLSETKRCDPEAEFKMHLRRKRMIFLIIVLGLLAACQRLAPADPTATVLQQVPGLGEPDLAPPPLDPAVVALGEDLYAIHCASCHGTELEGEVEWQMQNEDDTFRAPPHDDTGHTWHHADPVLLEAILLGGARLPAGIGGTSLMPAFAEVMTAAETAATLDFIKSRWPADIRAVQWEQTQRVAQQ